MITEKQLAEIEERASKAAPGPWRSRLDNLNRDNVFAETETGGLNGFICSGMRDNAQFIAHSRTDIPNLISAIRERDEVIKKLRGALGFYGKKEHWLDSGGDTMLNFAPLLLNHDGEFARRVLAETKEYE